MNQFKHPASGDPLDLYSHRDVRIYRARQTKKMLVKKRKELGHVEERLPAGFKMPVFLSASRVSSRDAHIHLYQWYAKVFRPFITVLVEVQIVSRDT